MKKVKIRVLIVDGYGEEGFNDFFIKEFESKEDALKYVSENESLPWFGNWETIAW